MGAAKEGVLAPVKLELEAQELLARPLFPIFVGGAMLAREEKGADKRAHVIRVINRRTQWKKWMGDKGWNLLAHPCIGIGPMGWVL